MVDWSSGLQLGIHHKLRPESTGFIAGQTPWPFGRAAKQGGCTKMFRGFFRCFRSLWTLKPLSSQNWSKGTSIGKLWFSPNIWVSCRCSLEPLMFPEYPRIGFRLSCPVLESSNSENLFSGRRAARSFHEPARPPPAGDLGGRSPGPAMGVVGEGRRSVRACPVGPYPHGSCKPRRSVEKASHS